MVAAAPLLGLALTAGGAAMQYSAASSANKARERSTQQWLSYQKQKRSIQQMKDEQNRAKAQAAQEGAVNQLGQSPDAVNQETQRLSEDLNSGNMMEAAPEATTNDQLLAAQGADQGFKTYAAKQLHNAATDARKKTQALASMQAYTGSQHGFQNRTNNILMDANQQIDLRNNYRKGDLSTYQLAQNIQPLQVGEASGGIGNAMADIGGKLMGGGKGSTGF
jgi:hypothetical protein